MVIDIGESSTILTHKHLQTKLIDNQLSVQLVTNQIGEPGHL